MHWLPPKPVEARYVKEAWKPRRRAVGARRRSAARWLRQMERVVGTAVRQRRAPGKPQANRVTSQNAHLLMLA